MYINETFTSDLPVICHPKKISSSGIYHGESPLDFSLPLLLLQVTLLVIMNNIVRFILRPLKQPAFVSHVIGGLLVGPSAFGYWKTLRDIMFPERSLGVSKIGASIGSIYYFFIIGVKYDPKLIINSGRNALVIAFISAIIPFTLISSFFLISMFISKSVEKINFHLYLATTLSLSSFPNLIPILNELNLLNSKLGRLAIAASTNHNVTVWVIYTILGVLKNSTLSPYWAFCYVIAVVALMVLLFCIIRPLMFSIIEGTQERLDDRYIKAILLGVLLISFYSDFIGDVPTMGALFFGLAMPEGPPLGAALVKKCELITHTFFLPLVYSAIGLKTNVSAIFDWTAWRNLQSLIILGYTAKILATILASRYLKMPFDDSLSLAFIMSFRDLFALIAFMKMYKDKVIDDQTYTTLVLSTLAMTAIATPLVRRFSQNTKTYMPYGLRTVQHTNPNAELRIVTCVHTLKNVPCMIKLLEASCTTRDNPLLVWNMNLVDLDGLAAPMLISDHSAHGYSSYSRIPHIKQINNAFQGCKQRNGRWLSIQSFTSVAPYRTMYHDVCLLALGKKASLIVMPFYKTMDGDVDHTLRILNSNVLNEAPCSVGIMVDCRRLPRNSPRNNRFYHICVVFFGGADDREALCYGLRMVGRPNVKLDVVRFLPNAYNTINERIRQVDDRLISMFRIKCAGNDRIAYREEIVYHCRDTIDSLRCMTTSLYNLMVVGRRHDNILVPLQGLSAWCENPELGVIGDIISSSDFSEEMVPVLVLQQQIHSGIGNDKREHFTS